MSLVASDVSTLDLLSLNADIMAELKRRGILRSANNPTGDYAEWLFAQAFGWSLAANSKAHYDAFDRTSRTYQIKCRRIDAVRGSRQLGVIRNLTDASFDYLAALLIDARYRVYRAALVPVDVVKANSVFMKHVNGWRFMLTDGIWEVAGVLDVTQPLREVEDQLKRRD